MIKLGVTEECVNVLNIALVVRARNSHSYDEFLSAISPFAGALKSAMGTSPNKKVVSDASWNDRLALTLAVFNKFMDGLKPVEHVRMLFPQISSMVPYTRVEGADTDSEELDSLFEVTPSSLLTDVLSRV